MNGLEISRQIWMANLTNAELDGILATIKMKRDTISASNIRGMLIGDMVEWESGKRNMKLTGIVQKIGRKFIEVDAGLQGRWKVPANMVSVV
jgi:hypothetical protein